MREQIGRLVHQDEHDDRRGCDHRGEAAVAHFHAHALLPVLIVHCRPSCSDAPICSIFGQCACSGPISSIISSCSAGALATSCLYSVGDIPGSLRTRRCPTTCWTTSSRWPPLKRPKIGRAHV